MNTKNPKKVCGGYKSGATRKITKAEEYIAVTDREFSDREEAKIITMISELKLQMSRWETDFQSNLSHQLDDADSDIYEKELIDQQALVEKCTDSLEDYLKNLRAKVNAPTQVQGDGPAATGGALGGTSHTVKIDETLKPEKLLRSFSLEEFNAWSDKFKAYFDHNKKTVDKSIVISRQLLNNVLDLKLLNALKTEEGVQDATPILAEGGCLDKLKSIFLKESPLFVRRYNFLKHVQDPREPFSDWWVAKKSKARECDFENITREDIMLLGLMTGVYDPKLKEKFLRQEKPTTEQLVKIAESWQRAERLSRDMATQGATANKTSGYQAGKQKEWNNHRERSKSKGPGPRAPGPKGNAECRTCGNSQCKRGKLCPAKEKKCNVCNKVGHYGRVCRDKPPTPGTGSRVKSIRVQVKKAQSSQYDVLDDNEPIPLVKMLFRPLPEGLPFEVMVFPDQGSSQSVISYDLVKRYGLHIDYKNKKVIEDAQNGRMDCTGSTAFEIDYLGNKTNVLALVSKSIKNECLLGWRALQRLRIIPENFPLPITGVEVRTTLSTSSRAPETQVEDLIEEFSNVFDTSGPLKPMKGGPMTIHLRGKVKPQHLNVPRKVAYAYQEDAKKKLDEDVALGVIEKVDMNDGPSDWCLPMTFARKPSGKIRSLLDAVVLNDDTDRPVHPFPSPKDIVSTIPPDVEYFAVFDCLHGYWQIELDEKSKPLTTFITEFGRYRYKRAPMGLVSSGDEFCARTDKALAGIPGVMKLVDDILIVGKDEKEIVQRIRSVFERCDEWGITLAKTKYQFGKKVKFAGYILTNEGVSPDPEKVAAIKNFPTPQNHTDVRSWFGLTNRFSEFVPDLKVAMEPLKGLQSAKNAFVWTPEHENSMKLTKEIITKENGPVRRHFDPSLPVELYTDASRKGVGYILTQRDNEDKLRLITCGSRFITDAEKNYAVIELECLAIQWAVDRCRLYLAGTNFTVFTDHKPLLGIMNGKNLDAINNTRIQRLLSKLLGYCYTVKWIPGKTQTIADALSRFPVFQPEKEEETDVLLRHIHCQTPDPALRELSEAAIKDESYQKVYNAIRDKKILKNLHLEHPGWHFKNQWDSMKVDETYNLLLYHDRIIVPKDAQKKILELLHIQHTGIVKTYDNARQLYFWCNMKNDIKNTVSSCEDCMRLLPSQPLEPEITTHASRPFEAVSTDLGKQAGINYLIVVDRYSGWPMVVPLKDIDTKAITTELDDCFIDYGKPERLRSDGGPQFRDEFKSYLKDRNIIHELSSAYHHESNGHAENAVREMKRLLEKTNSWSEFRKALREYRNSPRKDGLSPAQWLYGRRQRTDVPAVPQAYRRLTNDEIDSFDERRREGEVEVPRKRTMPQLKVGQEVLVQNPKSNLPTSKRWESKGTIIKKRSRRSYVINIDGREYLRNRRFLKPYPDLSPREDDAVPELSTITNSPESEKPKHDPPILPQRKSQRTKKKIVRFDEYELY